MQKEIQKRVDFGISMSFILYVISAVLKIVAAILSGSIALLADGLNSTTDVLATIIMYVGVRISRKPKDHNHAYGHKRFEQVSTMIAVFIMGIAGVEALHQGIVKLLHPINEAPTMLGFYAALLGSLLILISWYINYTIYKSTKVLASKVIAKDNFSDALVSIGTACTIVATQFHFYSVDALASLVIAFIILHTCYELMNEAILQLTDGYDPRKIELYTNIILKVPGVLEVLWLRGRTHGVHEYLEATIRLSEELTLVEAHEIAEMVEQCLYKNINVEDVMIHYEP